MALKLFTDTQKGNLAKEAGVIWTPSTDSFGRDTNPDTGEATMYMKIGNNQKFYGKGTPKVDTFDPVIASAMRMQNEALAQRTYDAYQRTQNTVPTSKAMVQNDINVRYNYQDDFEAITQQRAEIYKQMAGDHSSIFSATNPDGSPVDPRVKVAQYQANLKGAGDRLAQLDALEQTKRSEAKVLGDAEYNRQVQENEKAKTALLYLKQIADTEQQGVDNAFRDKQLGQNQSQFDANLNKPNYVQDTKTGEWVDKNSNVSPDIQKLSSPSATPKDLLSAPNWAVIPGKYGVSDTNSSGGLQCGEYVNKITWLNVGDSYQSKLDKMNVVVNQPSTNAPEGTGVWNAVVWNPAPNDPKWNKFGHTGVIVGEQGNSWIIKSANLHGDGAISTDAVPKSAIAGYNTKVNPIAGNGQTSQPQYSKDDYMNSIIQGAWGASKLSDYDSRRIEWQIQGFMDKWLTPQEALLKYKGFVINDPQNIETATQVFNIFNQMEKAPAGYEARVSGLVNKGDAKNLNNYINTALDREIMNVNKTEATSTPEMQSLQSNTNELVSLIEKNKDKIGAFDGRVEEFYSKFADTPDFQKIKTLLQWMQATQRKFFAGSAVTPTEMEALKDFIWGTQNMNANNLVTQLKTVEEQAMKKYTSQRAMYLGDYTQWQAVDITPSSTPPAQNNPADTLFPWLKTRISSRDAR